MADNKIKILMVEDNPGDVRLIEEMIKEAGASQFNLSVEGSLDGALGCLRKESFEGVMLDLNLPDCQGLATLKSIQGNFSHVAVIVVTGLNDEAIAIESLRNGAEDFLIKGKFDSFLLVRSLRYAIERKQAEEALRESEEKFRNLVENASVGIFREKIDGSEVLDANPKLCDMLGLTREEFVGQPSAIAWANPERREEMVRLLRENGGVNNYEIDIRTKSGEIRTVIMSITAYPKLGYLEGGLQDITERKKVEEVIKKEKETAQKYLDIAGSMLLVLDATGNISLVNKKGCEILDGTSDELTGLNWFDHFLLKEDKEKLKDVFATLMRGEIEPPVEYADNLIISKKGTEKWIRWHNTIIKNNDGTIIGTLSSGEDITERKQMEYKLSEAYQKIKTHTKELEIINENLDSFAYSVSHDLRAPLRAISGFSQVLIDTQRDKVNEEMRHYLNRINEGAQKMGQLIDDLLDFSRVTRGEIKYEEINVEDIVNDLVKAYRDVEQGRDIEFIVNPLGDVEADREMLKVVFSNLLQNAIKFTSDRKKACIEIGRELKEDDIQFYVKDNGIGFDMRYKDKLFTAFQRLHTDARFSGTGIGLSTVKRIVLKHGGNIWAKGEVDKGAEFYFTLPSKTHVED